MSRPALSAPAADLTVEERAALRQARQATATLNRLLWRRGSDRRYGVLIADAPHAGLFLEPELAGEVA